jgi:hypothetical protein
MIKTKDRRCDNVETAKSSDYPRQGNIAAGVTWRSVSIAVVMSVLAAVWVRQSEIVALTTQITESVPAIPGLATLTVLLAVNPLLRRLHLRPLTAAEMLTIFFFVCVSSTVTGMGVTEFLVALITTPFYVAGAKPAGDHLSAWLAPHDLTAVRWLYEGAPHGQVLWNVWLRPGLLWLLFLALLWMSLYCLCHLFFRVWSRDEKLSFPLVTVVSEIAGETGGTPFFRNRLMWLGFGIAAAYNLVNILHSFQPASPAVKLTLGFNAFTTTPPWTALSDVNLMVRPELIGLGFLVQTDLSLSIWLSYVLLRLASVLGVAYNIPVAPGGSEPFPYAQEQGLGGYLLIALALFWKSRVALGAGLVDMIRRRNDSPRWPYVGLLVGVIGSWTFMSMAGVSTWVAGLYLAIVLAVALVYSRIRAESGVPLNWLFPFGMQKDFLLFTFGGNALADTGASTLPGLTMFSFLSRGYFPETSGYQIETMEAGRRYGVNQFRLAGFMLLALVVGVVCGWYFHIAGFSQIGALHKNGMWGGSIAEHDYTTPTSGVLRSQGRIDATVSGAAVAALLTVLRQRIAGFPLNPLGYVMACSYGDLLWGPFLIVWGAKSIIIRAGGLHLYRKAVPFFLGFALGHLAVAGVLWGLVGACFGDVVHGYAVWFG